MCPANFIEDPDKSLGNMETSQKYAPLPTGPGLAGSVEALVPPETTRGASNRRAFKIAGLTTLACLLLASQVFTAYTVFNQNKQIQSLQTNSEDMHKELKTARTRMPAVQMRMPMNSMPLLTYFDEDEAMADAKPMKKLEDTALEEKVKGLLQNSQLPQFNETFLANLQTLKEQMEESEWKGFESWMRHWLIFQMAQQPPAPPTQTAVRPQTKCEKEASGKMWPGTFKPKCDVQGRYKPKQCHGSIGYCWCVDESGTEIPQTRSRGKLDCSKAPHRRMMAFPRMMAFSDGDE